MVFRRVTRLKVAPNQWRNWRGGGCRVPPETSDREISAELPGKRGKEKGKTEQKKKENRKGKVENLKMEERTFSKPLKFLLGLPKWEFSTGKNDQEKRLCPLWKIFFLCPCTKHGRPDQSQRKQTVALTNNKSFSWWNQQLFILSDVNSN